MMTMMMMMMKRRKMPRPRNEVDNENDDDGGCCTGLAIGSWCYRYPSMIAAQDPAASQQRQQHNDRDGLYYGRIENDGGKVMDVTDRANQN
jgi:hypothetical protein